MSGQTPTKLRFRVYYERHNGRSQLLGWETATSEAEALEQLIKQNPHHEPDRFVLKPA